MLCFGGCCWEADNTFHLLSPWFLLSDGKDEDHASHSPATQPGDEVPGQGTGERPTTWVRGQKCWRARGGDESHLDPLEPGAPHQTGCGGLAGIKEEPGQQLPACRRTPPAWCCPLAWVGAPRMLCQGCMEKEPAEKVRMRLCFSNVIFLLSNKLQQKILLLSVAFLGEALLDELLERQSSYECFVCCWVVVWPIRWKYELLQRNKVTQFGLPSNGNIYSVFMQQCKGELTGLC